MQGVRAGGEHRDLGTVLDLEVHVGALGAADPVALHRQHPLGPVAGELVHVVEQGVRVLGDAEVPLVQGALGDLGAAALAAPVHDLLVREHGLVLRAPVDRGVLPVGQALAVQLLEEPLRPPVVLGVGGVQLAGPVDGDAVALEGALLRLDVGVGPLGRVRVPLDGGVLGGQAEGVPADGVQHVVAALHPVAGDDVAHRERLGVAHVQVAGGVGEHVHDGARLGAVLEGAKVPACSQYPAQRASTSRKEYSASAGIRGWPVRRSGGLAHGGSCPHAVGGRDGGRARTGGAQRGRRRRPALPSYGDGAPGPVRTGVGPRTARPPRWPGRPPPPRPRSPRPWRPRTRRRPPAAGRRAGR